MARIKVLHIVEDLGMGGIEKVICNLCSGLDHDRFDTRVWCLTKGGVMADCLAQNGIQPEVLGMGPQPSISFIGKLARMLRREKIYILHCHGYTAGAVARTAAVLARVPRIVAHVHTTCENMSRKQLWIDRVLSLFTDVVICCSQAVADSVAERAGIARGKLSVVYNGTPRMLKVSPPGLKQKLGIPAGDSVILCAASLTGHKGHRYLLEAFALVLKQFPQTTLLLAGDGPLRPSLQELAGRLGVAAKTVFAGIYLEMEELLSLCYLAVLPSSEREGMSLWLAEAMSAGRPLVGTRIGGTPEVITHEANGLLVPPRDAPALAAALGRILSDPALAKSLGEAGDEIYLEKFTIEEMVFNVTAIYQRLS